MYQKQHWQDHVTTPGSLFTITDHGDGTYTITPAGKVMQQGTPQDQAHFNNMEEGIFDAHTAVALLLNYARQNSWEIENGTAQLTNSMQFPFNGSQKSVALAITKESADYIVLTEVVATDGNVGEIVVSDKLINGFKLAFTGSATAVTVKYTVIGGFMR